MIRAKVTEDFGCDGLRIQVANATERGTYLYGFTRGPDIMLEPDQVSPDTHRGLLLGEDEARAVWEELTRYFGAHPATQSDRADLLVERARVDKLTDAVILIATRP